MSLDRFMNYALRMVIPIRREFGRALDVQHFLHDLSYAKEVIDEARQSQNPKLREYAEYLNQHMLGPRNTAAPASSLAQKLATSAPTQTADEVDTDQSTLDKEAKEAKKLLMAKYSSGLR